MEMPEIKRCFGVFPPKYATYLISLFGLSSGGLGIAGIVLYGIAEDLITSVFSSEATSQLNQDIKKLMLATIGLSSLLLVVANAFLIIGSMGKKRMAVHVGYLVILSLCCMLIITSIAMPVSCFFIPDVCMVKKVSTFGLLSCIGIVTIFLEVWFYFMAVAWNYEQEL